VEEVGAYGNNFTEKWLFHNGLADLHLGTLLLANHVSVATCCAVFAIVGLVQILHKTICYVWLHLLFIRNTMKSSNQFYTNNNKLQTNFCSLAKNIFWKLLHDKLQQPSILASFCCLLSWKAKSKKWKKKKFAPAA